MLGRECTQEQKGQVLTAGGAGQMTFQHTADAYSQPEIYWWMEM